MMAIGIIGSLASGVIGAMGASQQAEANARAAEKNAQIADYNAKVMERNKVSTLQAAESEASDQTRENRRALSGIRAAYGSSGLALEGSPLDVLEDTALEQELDVSKTRYTGQMKAIGYEDEKQNYKMKSELARMEADSARKAGKIAVVSSLLGGVTGAAKAGMSMR